MLSLEIDRLELEEGRLPRCIWPVSQAEVVKVGEHLTGELAALARASSEPLLSIVILHLLNETLTLYRTHALWRRSAEQGHQLVPPALWSRLPAISSQAPPPPPPLLASLQTGPPRIRGVIRRAARSTARVVRHIRRNGLKGLFRGYDGEQDVVAIGASPLLECHARRSSSVVRSGSLGEWIGPSPQSGTLKGLPSATLDAVLQAVDKAFALGGETLPAHLAAYLRSWLDGICAAVTYQMEQLEPRQLPAHLWTETGGIIWTRILRHAVRQRGGTNTGFDHAPGAAIWKVYGREMIELDACDLFVTYTEANARVFQRRIRPELLLSQPAARIESVPSGLKFQHLSTTRRPGPIRTLLYPTTIYTGEEAYVFGTTLPDPVAVEWQHRLLRQLTSWGYRVLLKPHPESRWPAPGALHDIPGVELALEPFEEVLAAADALVYDYPLSTTFCNALATTLPIVLIDFGFADWDAETLPLLESRCPVVRGWQEATTHRMQVEWDHLREALSAAPDLATDQSLTPHL